MAATVPVPSASAAEKERAFTDETAQGLLGALGIAIVGLAAMMERAGLTIDVRAPGTIAFGIAFAVLGAVRWRFRRPRSNAARISRDMAEYFALFTAVSLVGALASYPIAAFGHGFVDPALYRIDLAMHFDWLAWYRIVAAHAWLQALSRGSYAMIYISPAILLGYLAVTDQRREAYAFIIAVALAAAATLAVFRFAPAIGPFAYLWRAPIPYLPVSDLWQPDLIPQLREHLAPAIDLGHLVGLVSVPSFHAAAAVLLIAFAARCRPIRWPLIAANAAMLLATPVEGTHYLVDMIAGALIALGSLRAISGWRHGGMRSARRAPTANVVALPRA